MAEPPPSAPVRVDYGVPNPAVAPRRRAAEAAQGPSVLADVLGWFAGAGLVLVVAAIAAQEVRVGPDRPARNGPQAPAMAAGQAHQPRVAVGTGGQTLQ